MRISKESIDSKLKWNRSNESREKFSAEQIQSLEKAKTIISLIVQGEKDLQAEKSIKGVLSEIIKHTQEMALDVDYGSMLSEISRHQTAKIKNVFLEGKERIDIDELVPDTLDVFFCVVPLIEEQLKQKISMRYFDEIKSYETTGLLFIGSDLDFLFPNKTII